MVSNPLARAMVESQDSPGSGGSDAKGGSAKGGSAKGKNSSDSSGDEEHHDEYRPGYIPRPPASQLRRNKRSEAKKGNKEKKDVQVSNAMRAVCTAATKVSTHLLVP